MGSDDLQELHRLCVTALRDYISQANRTCKLLQSITEFPITVQIWKQAIEQRAAENDAHEQYMYARERLLAAMRPASAPKIQ